MERCKPEKNLLIGWLPLLEFLIALPWFWGGMTPLWSLLFHFNPNNIEFWLFITSVCIAIIYTIYSRFYKFLIPTISFIIYVSFVLLNFIFAIFIIYYIIKFFYIVMLSQALVRDLILILSFYFINYHVVFLKKYKNTSFEPDISKDFGLINLIFGVLLLVITLTFSFNFLLLISAFILVIRSIIKLYINKS